MATCTKEALKQRLLDDLRAGKSVPDSLAWAEHCGCGFELASREHYELLSGLLLSLDSKHVITAAPFSTQGWELTDAGKEVLAKGSPEFLLFKVIASAPDRSVAKDALQKDPHYKVGFPEAMKFKWIKMNGAAVTTSIDTDPEDKTRKSLSEIHAGRAPDKSEELVLKTKKKYLKQETKVSYKVGKGESFDAPQEDVAADLTVEALKSGRWATQPVKAINLNAMGAVPAAGYLHPLNKVRCEVRQIFLEMGFEEMPTNNYVESSFWNFDSLFQPQQHPARDLHDTFFLREPASASAADCDPAYLERVRSMHEKGGDGSIGWRYNWKIEEARKNILRTHTTAVSSRMLYKLATSPDGFHPVKCFSMDRVFRNETLDPTHLAEFHQIEGFIADRNIGLPHLIGVLSTFFSKMGITKLRFKPAFNPYTEPSMEIFCFHPQLGKEIEIGNSGVFRPEMLGPMGLPKDVSVIAWGLSLERPTMIKYGIPSIKLLFGPESSVESIRRAPVCVLTKETN
eukprot:TRINITY_DN3683_c0_g1_i1.p1 TRINITY_DN3683_c0_g1~~TRINITY_DN3683_c0_g1_i1.p1  ORF type:complete len:523 (-),score=153.07 TRINITY_DN3683_c0_g1_i1:19-1554(-)